PRVGDCLPGRRDRRAPAPPGARGAGNGRRVRRDPSYLGTHPRAPAPALGSPPGRAADGAGLGAVDRSPIQKLDRIIHEKGRLAILAFLAPAESLSFKELRDLLEMTDGNLCVHMRTLEECQYVRVEKDFVDRKPRTTYSLTPEGRRAFADY